ncbi:hypothetical protein GOP47_0010558, partial [Adiantum capillus-veneris]
VVGGKKYELTRHPYAKMGAEVQAKRMNFKHSTTVLPSSTSIAKVTALAWSPNSRKLAAATITRIVHLFDESGALKEKFATKPADAKGSKLYIVIGMVFSPDSTKLAIAQSDDIIFIYKLGLDWGEKKSICNKFQQTLPINSIVWPHLNQIEILFGLCDGKVKAGQLRTNRTITLHTHGSSSPVVSLACSPDGCTCLAGHLDGAIYRFSLDKVAGNFAAKFANHGFVPTVLGWGKNIILVTGSDSKVALYDLNGALMHVFDCINEKGFTSATFNSTGEILVLGSYNGFHIFQKTGSDDIWEDCGRQEVENSYTISLVAWKPDGSQVAIGGFCGNVDLYDAFMKRQRYSDKFEFIYISKGQVILTQLSPYTRMLLQSQYGWHILRINIYMEQFLIAYTEETLLLGNLENCKLSEIVWHGSGHEKFLLDDPKVCLVHDSGELFLVEYGCNEIITTVQTDHAQEALISIRLDHKFSSIQPTKHGSNRLAYLLGMQTVQVKDILSGDIVDTVNHTCDIVWLQLNPRATHLLFCDKTRRLFLFDLGEQKCATLLNICNFVQWVPDTNVIIAQSQCTLYIWYSIQNIQHATRFSLKGDLEGVRRLHGQTEVLVYEGFNTVSYELDEALIDIGLALEKSDFDHAFSGLEPVDLTVETKFLWKQLGNMCLQRGKHFCAQHSYALLGEVCRSDYLRKVNKRMQFISKEPEQNERHVYSLQANLKVLSEKWKDAEHILLEHGHIEDTIRMYTDAFRWKEALAISYAENSVDNEMLRSKYLEWLCKTGQIEDAGKQMASSADINGAIKAALLGNLPGLAADYVLKLPRELQEGLLIDEISSALVNAGMLEKLGELMESLGDYEKAQRAYQNAHSFRKAVQLAQRQSKKDVVKIQEEWGDYLVSKNEMEEAVNHYLEAGCQLKAIESAIAAHQWSKAIQIAMQQNKEVVKPIYVKLARKFEKIKQFADAEKMFINAELPHEAVNLYLKANKWEAAKKVASQFLLPDEAHVIFMHQAKEFESFRRFKDAEKLYLELGQHDSAINMYKVQGMFDNVIQLVAKFRKDGLHETHLYLAKELEQKGMLRDAESHYLEVQDWKSAMKMYSMAAMWEDAIRIARSWGGISAVNEVAYVRAIETDGNKGIDFLTKQGLLDQAIDYAVDIGAFNNALQLCSAASTDKLEEVQVKFARFLEGQGHFHESEDSFIKAGKPMEAIKMYINQKDWKAALRVADLFQPSALADILVSQAQFFVQDNELKKAEALFIQAKKPELAVWMYKSRNLWDDAICVAQKFMPDGLNEIQCDFTSFLQSKNANAETLDAVFIKALAAESSQNFHKVIDLYMQMDLKTLPDMEKLQKVWYKALDLAKEHAKNRLPEVMHAVAMQFIRAGQHQEAAQLYLENNHYKEAAEVLISGGHWEHARKVGESLGQEKLSEDIERLYKEHLFKTGEAGLLVDIGGVQEALDIYSSNEDWDKVHELSASMGPEAQKECSARHVAHCLQNSKLLEAISVVSCYGLPNTLESFELCGQLASRLLFSCSDTSVSSIVMQEFRTFLYKYLQDTKGCTSPNSQSAFEDLEAMLIPLTYMVLRGLCQQREIKELAAKLSVSLLRFVQSLPADVAFYNAGMACREVGWNDKAFVFFNQYLDIAEAIDDKETSIAVDHPSFSKSDIPQALIVPKGHFVDVDKQEDIQEWVIQYSVNQQEEKFTMARECEICQTSIFEASLCCFSCKAQSKACTVTGYPVDDDACTECPFCHMLANTCDWRTFLEEFHSCPWCNGSMEASNLQRDQIQLPDI